MTFPTTKRAGALALAAAFVLAACSKSGSEGAPGPAGPTGPTGPTGPSGPIGTIDKPTTLKAEITGVTSTAVVGTVVSFKLRNQSDQLVPALPSGAAIGFIYTKLKDGQWKSYFNRSVTGATKDSLGNAITPVLDKAIQATTQTGTAGIVAAGDGSYQYTFTDVNTTAEAVPFEAGLTHRVAMQVSGTGLAPTNAWFDFVPSGGAVTQTRDIATTASCLACHSGGSFAFHGGPRVEVEYCVTCHNPGTVDPESGNSVTMPLMIHKIHAGEELVNGYTIYGYGVTKYDFTETTYPQPLKNCRTCHTASDKTPNGDNWSTKPSREACGACHDAVNFATGTGHPTEKPEDAVQTDDSKCATCHTADRIKGGHANQMPSAHNPDQISGLSKFEYAIVSTSSDAVPSATTKRVTVKFTIKKDGALVTLDAFQTGGTNPFLSLGFSGGPSFYVAYNTPQDGIAAPADWNAAGGYAAGTASAISLANVWDGTKGTLTKNDDGSYTAVLGGGTGNAVTLDLPSTATIANVVLLGAISQLNGETATGIDWNKDGDLADAISLPVKSVSAAVAGYAGRRQIVSDAKCSTCHESLGVSPDFHGGARNDGATCAICHSPNRGGSSGWSSGYREFVHAVHGASQRTNQFGWHAASATDGYWNVTYPAELTNCEACHLPKTFDYSAAQYTPALMASLLPSTITTSNYTVAPPTGTAFPTVAVAPWLVSGNYADTGSAATLNKSANLVTSPITATCIGCHDSVADVAHYRIEGGKVYVARGTSWTNTETCMLCHGPGQAVSITDAHKGL